MAASNSSFQNATRAFLCIAVLSSGCWPSDAFLTGSAQAPNPPSVCVVPQIVPGDQRTLEPTVDFVSASRETFLPELAELRMSPAPQPERSPTSKPVSLEPSVPDRFDAPANDALRTVWGIIDFRGFPVGDQMASNGVEFHQLFVMDLSFNIMLCREKGVYLFADSFFWGQKPAPGITNPTQGPFDFSKREFDFTLGAAWNYSGPWEARVFAYSFNNLNRGNSLTSPAGFNDGIGVENRYYIDPTYARLGTAEFDQARATFVSVGYYPSKTLEDGIGRQFKPGAFARAYLTFDLWGPRYYAYSDLTFTASRSFTPTILNWDAGLAMRPIHSLSRLEFRIGTLGMFTVQGGDSEKSLYVSVRYVF
jgi:hypothetical protein